jgi:mRNA (2'-O-methyladenosine-N6-)-methyltransferase
MVKKVKRSSNKKDKSKKLKNDLNDSSDCSSDQIKQIEKHIYLEELKFFEEQHNRAILKNTPEDCIPISADVRTYNFDKLIQAQTEVKGKLFDAIMMDPPWQLSGATPTRGVTISYEALSDQIIKNLPIVKLQKQGLLFLWTINAKYRTSLQLLDDWGYRFVDEIAWVKKTCNNKIAKSHGYWLQHAKETCLVGIKGNFEVEENEIPDIIFSLRRGQSQKPEEIYQMIEAIVPNGCYLEIFGRRNNLRNGWITIGNEL